MCHGGGAELEGGFIFFSQLFPAFQISEHESTFLIKAGYIHPPVKVLTLF